MQSQDSPTDPIEITVAISCYNEAAFIADTIEHVAQALEATGHSYEILVVDDVSTDNSVETIRAYINAHPQRPIRLVQHEINRGRANTFVETAFLGRGKYYRMCCGDDSEAPEALLTIFRHVGVADIVVPVQDQRNVAGKTACRKGLSRTYTLVINLLSGYRIRYYNGMAVHLRSNVMRWPPASYGFGFEADIMTRILDEGASYVQIPAFGTDRKGGGASPITMRNLLSIGHTLLEISIRRIRKILFARTMRKPMERPALDPPDTGRKP